MLEVVEEIKELLQSSIGSVVQWGAIYANLYNICIWVGQVSHCFVVFIMCISNISFNWFFFLCL